MRLMCFNPRAREGRDAIIEDVLEEIQYVSIHAPVKGATQAVLVLQVFLKTVSIHAPVKGAT